MEDAWLIVKRDLYYMPGGHGYTGIRDNAGRYTHQEAMAHHNPESGESIIRLADAPEFSKACWDDVARDHLRRKRDEVEGALCRILYLIDAAGLDNLANGVRLGPTSWYVKMSEAMEAAKTLLPPNPNKA